MNMLTSTTVTMSSREIADLTGKQHQHVKRDIEKMLGELNEDASIFGHIYLDSMNREQTEYRLNRELTETLLLGYSAPLRLKVIRRLRELEAAVASPRPLTTTETLIQMLTIQAEVERRQAEQGEQIAVLTSQVSLITQAHTVLEKMPTDCEGIERIRKRMNKEYGLSVTVVDKIMRDSPYAPTIRVLVRNPHAEGVHNSGFSIKEVSAIFKRFADEAKHSAGKLYTHPYIEGRFKLTRRE
ncbi:Rha family transcriptional regulator [Rhizobium sp. NTR19]|uniref:Rha family transcriptional regulator n=1 Tax=Neorhizobium turbinariae TaxID=2937795 RepID=A0ABT0IMI6_9HYPH|nr:Rha family transcriptional regulator [Neorhizobium turbinariae]MCK8779058.1 Rha family transcriptional regulator [Neorhizobium turbinariae]